MDEQVMRVLRAVAEGWQDYDEVQHTFAIKCHFCGQFDEHDPNCVVLVAQRLLAAEGIRFEET